MLCLSYSLFYVLAKRVLLRTTNTINKVYLDQAQPLAERTHQPMKRDLDSSSPMYCHIQQGDPQ